MRPGLGPRGPVPSCDHGSRSEGKSGRPATYQASGGWERRVVLRAVVQGRLTLRDPSLAGHDTPRPHERQSFGGSDTVRLAGEGPPALPCLLYHGVSRGEGEKVGSCWVFMVSGGGGFARFRGERTGGAASALKYRSNVACWAFMVGGGGGGARSMGGAGRGRVGWRVWCSAGTVEVPPLRPASPEATQDSGRDDTIRGGRGRPTERSAAG